MTLTLHEPPPASPLAITLLAVAIALSLGLFLYRFLPIFRTILRSRPDAAFTLRPLGHRIWAFTSEVLLQSKVIRQRPLPGIAHAFVFWGFLAFALVSLNHLALGLRLGFLSPSSLPARIYFLFVALWAVAVALSIAALFYRRFLVRPRWLGPTLSWESGLIALLIFLLMATYLAALLPLGPATLAALWWMHTLSLLVFLPLIPHTKHLHLVLSPATVFLKRPVFSDIPPLQEGTNPDGSEIEDFGLVTGTDLTRLIALQAYSCVECGRCTEHCPAATTGKALNPKEIVLGTRAFLNTFGPASPTPLLANQRPTPPGNSVEPAAAAHLSHLTLQAAFECTTCGACEFQCPVGIQHLPILVGLRRGAVNTGAWDDSYGTKLFLALEKTGNSHGLPANHRDQFVVKEGFPLFDGTQEYCLWLGCMGGYDPKGREIIADFARIMRHLGTTFGVLKKEKCTGDPARRLGNDLIFSSLAESGLKTFAAARVQKIVAICPHCVRTIATDWAQYGISPHIEHHSEFIARHQDRLPCPTNPSETVVYHDPCYLGRYQDIYDQPRAVVEQQATLVEAPRHRERSFCCGAGGGLAFLGEEGGSARVSHVRAQELVATGAATIGTACPFCNTMFRDALASIAPASPPQLLDIAQLTARALPPAS